MMPAGRVQLMIEFKILILEKSYKLQASSFKQRVGGSQSSKRLTFNYYGII